MDSLTSNSSLEEMLESIKQRQKKTNDLPPALPTRPTSMARRPTSRFRSMQTAFSAKMDVLVLQDRRDYVDVKNAAATLQSFIRGEIVRYNSGVSLKRQRAALVIQKHVRQWIAKASADGQQKEFVDFSSEGSSGKITFKTNRNIDENLPTSIKEFDNQHPLVHLTVAALQSQVINAEAALGEKEEIALLQEKLQESEKKCLEYEKSMKSMQQEWQKQSDSLQEKLQESEKRYLDYEKSMKSKEQAWQKQLISLQEKLQESEKRCSEYEKNMKPKEQAWQKRLVPLQMNIASAKTSPAPDNSTNNQGMSPICQYYDCEDETSDVNRTSEKVPIKQPTNAGQLSYNNGTIISLDHLIKEFDQRRQVFEDDAGLFIQSKSRRLSTNINTNGEFHKLKSRFTSWKKDCKSRLRETKSTLKKLGHSEEKITWKTWWRKRN